MIQKHEQFIAAIRDQKKVSVRFYSQADNGVLERICAPMGYGQAGAQPDELSRYWLWDYASTSGVHALGLMPQQIVDLQVLGTGFDPAEFATKPEPGLVSPTVGLPAPAASSSGGVNTP